MTDHICNTGEPHRAQTNKAQENEDEAKKENVYKDPEVEAVLKSKTKPKKTIDSANGEGTCSSICVFCQGKIRGHIMHVLGGTELAHYGCALDYERSLESALEERSLRKHLRREAQRAHLERWESVRLQPLFGTRKQKRWQRKRRERKEEKERLAMAQEAAWRERARCLKGESASSIEQCLRLMFHVVEPVFCLMHVVFSFMCGVLASLAKPVLWVLRMLWYFISFEETPSLSTTKHRLRDLGSMLQGRENKCLQVLLLHLLKKQHMFRGTDFCTQLEVFLAQNGERSECETQSDTEDNFHRVLLVLSLFSAHIKLLCQTDSQNSCKWFSLGEAETVCLGHAVYDANRGHVYLLEGSDLESLFLDFPSMEVPSNFSAGGKKRTCQCKCDDKVQTDATASSSLTAEEEERIRHLVAIARTPCVNKKMYGSCVPKREAVWTFEESWL